MQEIFDEHLRKKLIADSHLTDQFSINVEPDLRLFLFPAKSFIVNSAETPKFLYYMVSGRAKLYDTLSNGRVALIDFFDPPCFIGEMELIDPDSKPYSVQSVRDCWCLGLTIKDHQSELIQDATFLRSLSIYLSHKNIRNISTASQNQSFSLAERFAYFILLTSHGDTYDEKHVQVAQYLGVTYRHLLYVLANFVDQGYLEKNGKHYQITNRNELEKIAKEVKKSDNNHD